MRAWLFAVVLAVGTAASADPPASSVTLEGTPSEPALVLDPLFRTDLEGIGATEVETGRLHFALGAHARGFATTAVWTNDRDVVADGYRIAAHLERDLAWGFTLTLDSSLTAMMGGIDRENGNYLDTRLAVSRLFRWSHHRVAWLALGAELTAWLGASAPPPAPTGMTVGIWAGTTF